LRRGGELVLETLVVEGEKGYSLIPDSRYARMPNVWFLPSIPTLEQWVTKAGYRDVRVVDDNWTSVEEQHTTSWMTFESLPEALDKDNRQITIEGYPAPRRAVIIARKP
jgi:tRNA (mo5U34)-methyltransferase